MSERRGAGLASLVVVAAGIGGALYLGRDNAMNMIWPNSAAPWETVDAFYYPDRSKLSGGESQLGLSSVESCRSWAHQTAATLGDPSLTRGYYECGVGFKRLEGPARVYRAMVQ